MIDRDSPLLSVEHVTVSFSGYTALDDLSFSLGPGAVGTPPLRCSSTLTISKRSTTRSATTSVTNYS